MCGGVIYKITNIKNNKIYIGLTSKSIEHRFYYHLRDDNQCRLLANAIRKYGKESFKIEEVFVVFKKEDLSEFEQYFIRQLSLDNK